MDQKQKPNIPEGAVEVTMIIDPTPDAVMDFEEWQANQVAEIEAKGVVVQSITGGTISKNLLPGVTRQIVMYY